MMTLFGREIGLSFVQHARYSFAIRIYTFKIVVGWFYFLFVAIFSKFILIFSCLIKFNRLSDHFARSIAQHANAALNNSTIIAHGFQIVWGRSVDAVFSFLKKLNIIAHRHHVDLLDTTCLLFTMMFKKNWIK